MGGSLERPREVTWMEVLSRGAQCPGSSPGVAESIFLALAS